MNQRCPKCGSYDTSIAYLNYVGKAARVTAKIVGAFAVALVAGQHHGAHLGQTMMKKEESNVVKGHVCNKCGHEW